ncbi:MAG TPA: tyrosine-type recombinase/integrase [Sedimentisphaerales bacterium]|nr:tyrosine-type recombinase/integrase [Sedimentisphaerales bacterium]
MNTRVTIGYEPRNRKKPYIVRWYGEYDPHAGKQRRYCKSFRLKAQAEELARERAHEFSRGARRDKPTESLKVLCDRFLQTRPLRPASVELYRNTATRLQKWFGPERLIADISPDEAAHFISGLRPVRGQELSGWTIHRTLRHCRTMFRQAQAFGWVIRNPFESVKQALPDPRNWHYVTPDEFKRLLDAAPSLHWQAFYALCWTGGLRFAEAVALRWCDVDLKTGEVLLQGRSGTDTEPEFRLKSPRERTRRLRLPESTITILRRLRVQSFRSPYIVLDQGRCSELQRKWQAHRKAKGTWRWQAAFRNANREFQRHCRKAGIVAGPDESLSIHTLRKCAGKNWALINSDMAITQRLMGHRSLSTTAKFYDCLTEQDRARAARGMDALINAV